MTHNPCSIFGERYKQIREERGLSRRDVDHKMIEAFDEGVSENTQKNWERKGSVPPYARAGTGPPDYSLTIKRVCRILNVSPDYLYGFIETPDSVGELGLDPDAPAAPPSGERRRGERRQRRRHAS